MIKTRTIVISSRNKDKISEIIDILNKFPVVIKTLNDFESMPLVKEDGLTFDDNAYKKSSLIAKILGFPVIADDSGLVVPVLDGAPGVYSARYAGIRATDLQNCEKLLYKMKEHSDRRAYFKCVISLAVPNGNAITYEGKCYGSIAEQMTGHNGFGYDPLFFCDKFNKTFGQISLNKKNTISHRGVALKKMVNEFDKILKWIDLQMKIKDYTNTFDIKS